MVRVLNFFCVTLIGISILGLYHVSEKTRVARMELTQTGRQIDETRSAIGVLETEWSRVASPDRVQILAGEHGMNDSVSTQLSAFDQLPHRDDAALNNDPVRNASAEMPVPVAPSGF